MVNVFLLAFSVGRNIRENGANVDSFLLKCTQGGYVTVKTSRKWMESKSCGHTEDMRTTTIRI